VLLSTLPLTRTHCVLGVATALGAACLTACITRDAIAPGETRYVVHAVLDASVSTQWIFIERARTGIDSLPITWVSGAEVTIIGPAGLVMHAEEQSAVPDTSRDLGLGYRLSLDRYGSALIPGGTYALHVRTPDGTEITGTTTIPQTTSVLSEDTISFDPQRDTLELHWAQVPGAASYQITLRRSPSSPFGDSFGTSGAYRTFAKESFSLPGTAHTPSNSEIFPPRAVVDVNVAATDTNYYEYYRQRSDPYAGTAPSRLLGGEGVFGSIVPIVLRRLETF